MYGLGLDCLYSLEFAAVCERVSFTETFYHDSFGTKFKISSQFYFHCWNIILYIVLTALNIIDHVCIYHTKCLSLWHGRPVLNLFTYLVENLFLLLMLLCLVYFYIWAEYLLYIFPSMIFILR